MSNSMPGLVDPYKLAKRQQRLQGSIPVALMLRALNLLASDRGEVAYSLMFAHDAQGCCFISGQLQAKVVMRCQRCLRDFEQQLDCDFKVSPVADDEAAKNLSLEYEPILVMDAKLELGELIEDELILAMPIVALHAVDDEACKHTTETLSDKEQDLVNPFKILQELKLKNNDQEAENINGSTTKPEEPL